jgi:hypothetical protein
MVQQENGKVRILLAIQRMVFDFNNTESCCGVNAVLKSLYVIAPFSVALATP